MFKRYSYDMCCKEITQSPKGFIRVRSDAKQVAVAQTLYGKIQSRTVEDILYTQILNPDEHIEFLSNHVCMCFIAFNKGVCACVKERERERLILFYPFQHYIQSLKAVSLKFKLQA